MPGVEGELKGLMVAALGGDERAYRELLGRLSRYLRGYYKMRLTRAASSAGEAEDLVQETLMALQAIHLRSRATLHALALCHRTLQADRPSQADTRCSRKHPDRGCRGDRCA